MVLKNILYLTLLEKSKIPYYKIIAITTLNQSVIYMTCSKFKILLLTTFCVLIGCSTEPSEYRKNLLNSEYDTAKTAAPSPQHFCVQRADDLDAAGVLLSYALLFGAIASNSRNGTVGPDFQKTSDAQHNNDCNSASHTGINSH